MSQAGLATDGSRWRHCPKLPRWWARQPKPVIETGRSGGLDAPDAPIEAPLDLSAAISALRERGAQRVDPVQLQFIEALARRAAQHSGPARQLIDSKLAQALQDCGKRLSLADGLTKHAADPLASRGPNAASGAEHATRSPLADLLGHIARQASTEHGDAVAPTDMTRAEPPAELRTLRMFRSTWSQLSVDQQLTESLAKAPENAGPLNSNLLVLRSLKLMHETSPPYLRRFMAYVDALLWLDQAALGAAPMKKVALRGDAARKRRSASK